MNKLFEISNNFIEAAGKQLNNLNISEKTKSISDNVGSVIGNFTGRSGQIYDINGKRYTEVRLIAEGGFGFVFHVRDDYGQNFALKKMVVSERERIEAMKNEVSFMKKLRNNQNVVKIEGFKLVENPARRDTEVYLLMELCAGGSLLDIMNSREATRLDEREILSIFSDVCYAIQEMHSQNPPIAHRDLKIENILYCQNTNRYKLCDFGSATTKTFNTTRERERALAEDDINSFTTLFYRAPEMVDLYRQAIINEKVDIWALGCLLFKMAFYVDPFDGGSLQILNNGYKIPENSRYSQNLHSLIQFILVPDPIERPSINDVINRLQEARGRKGLNTYNNNNNNNNNNNYNNNQQQQQQQQSYNRSTPTPSSSSSLSSSTSSTPLYNSTTPNHTNTPPQSNRSTPNSTPPSTRKLFDILDGGQQTNTSPSNSNNNFKPQQQQQQQSLKTSSSSTSSPSILDDFDSWGNSPITTNTSSNNINNINNNNNTNNSSNNNNTLNNSTNNGNIKSNSFTFDNDSDFDFGSFVSSTTTTTTTAPTLTPIVNNNSSPINRMNNSGNNINNNFNNNNNSFNMNGSGNNININTSNNGINPTPSYNPNFMKPQVSPTNSNNQFDFFASTNSTTTSNSNLSHSTSSTSSSTSMGFNDNDILRPTSKQTTTTTNSTNMYNNNNNNTNNTNNYPKPNYSLNMNTLNNSQDSNNNNNSSSSNGNGNGTSTNNYNNAFNFNLF